MNRNYFLVRLKPGGIDRTQECLESNKIAMGWSRTGDISDMSKEAIRASMQKEYEYTGMSLSSNLASLLTIKERISNGDVVVTADGPNVSIGEVSSDYYFNEEAAAQDYGHQRDVSWKLKNISRDAIPEDLRRALRGQKTAYELKNVDEILEEMMDPEFEVEKLLVEKPKKKRGRPTKAESEARRKEKEAELLRQARLQVEDPNEVSEPVIQQIGDTRYVSQKYLLRPGTESEDPVWIHLSIPIDTTREEAERLATFVSSCYYE